MRASHSHPQICFLGGTSVRRTHIRDRFSGSLALHLARARFGDLQLTAVLAHLLTFYARSPQDDDASLIKMTGKWATQVGRASDQLAATDCGSGGSGGTDTAAATSAAHHALDAELRCCEQRGGGTGAAAHAARRSRSTRRAALVPTALHRRNWVTFFTWGSDSILTCFWPRRIMYSIFW